MTDDLEPGGLYFDGQLVGVVRCDEITVERPDPAEELRRRYEADPVAWIREVLGVDIHSYSQPVARRFLHRLYQACHPQPPQWTMTEVDSSQPPRSGPSLLMVVDEARRCPEEMLQAVAARAWNPPVAKRQRRRR